jgi:thioredoxin-related protein
MYRYHAKWVVILIIIYSFTFSIKIYGQETGGMKFTRSQWSMVLDEAAKSGKMIFMDFYFDGCRPCKIIETEIFPLEAAGKLYNKEFVNVRVDIYSEEGKILAEHYNTGPYPTLLFTDKQGTEIFRQIGADDIQAFLEAGTSALKFNKLISSIDTVKAHIRNNEFLPVEMQAYATYMKSNPANLLSEDDGAIQETMQYFKKYFATQSFEDLFSEPNLNIIYQVGELLSIRSREYHFLLQYRNLFYNRFNDSVVNNKIIVVPHRANLAGVNNNILFEVLNRVNELAEERNIREVGFRRYPSKAKKSSVAFSVVPGLPFLYLDWYHQTGRKTDYLSTARTSLEKNKSDFEALSDIVWMMHKHQFQDEYIYQAYAEKLAGTKPGERNHAYHLGAYGAALFHAGNKKKSREILEQSVAIARKNGEDYSDAEALWLRLD